MLAIGWYLFHSIELSVGTVAVFGTIMARAATRDFPDERAVDNVPVKHQILFWGGMIALCALAVWLIANNL